MTYTVRFLARRLVNRLPWRGSETGCCSCGAARRDWRYFGAMGAGTGRPDWSHCDRCHNDRAFAAFLALRHERVS